MWYDFYFRSFDFEIELKNGTVHTFSSIEKEEYAKLYDFITSKKLHVKNKKNVSINVDFAYSECSSFCNCKGKFPIT